MSYEEAIALRELRRESLVKIDYRGRLGHRRYRGPDWGFTGYPGLWRCGCRGWRHGLQVRPGSP